MACPRMKVYPADLGKFLAHQRANVDQVPFELDNQARKAYVKFDEASCVQISGPQDGCKRFGTLQMMMHPGFPIKQPKMGMFMRGAGTVYEAEKNSYHQSVEVFFSEKAWFTKTIGKAWVERVVKPWKEEVMGLHTPMLLFQDNLANQKDLTALVM